MRKNYLINTSIQCRFIAMSVLPVFLMSVFCIFFILYSGEVIIERGKNNLLVEISAFTQVIDKFEGGGDSRLALNDAGKIKQELRLIQDMLKVNHFETLKEWKNIKIAVFVIFSAVTILMCGLSFFCSHRVAGPFHRLERSLDMLAEGKDVQMFAFRHYDEFKEVAAALDRLRKSLKNKGHIK